MTSRRGFLCMLALTAGIGAVAGARESRAAAQTREPRLAALSLLGDRLLIVGSQWSTGSHLDRNRREVVELPNDDLDVATLREFEKRARAARPAVPVTPIRSRERALRELQDDIVAGKRSVLDIVERLRPALLAQGFTHLAVFTKHRGEARIRTANGIIGQGRLEGLGFFVDRWTRLRAPDTGIESFDGFLAPFAYFRASLVELAAPAVIAEEISMESEALGTLPAWKDTHPWDTLTADQKTAALQDLTARGLEAIVPRLLAKLPAAR